MSVSESLVDLGGGRVLRVHDTGPADAGLTVLWQHGTPNIGSPPRPLFADAAELGIRWVGHDRPGYGGSTPVPDRDVASVARDVAAVADALGIGRFAVMGHSGGGPHALACAALLPDRVLGAVSIAGLAPFDAAGLDWFSGMAPAGEAGLRAAAAGRSSKEAHEASDVDHDPDFTHADLHALDGEWGWLGSVVGPALASGAGPLIDDDLAYVRPWGFDPAAVVAPLLLVHGVRDRVVPVSHARWLGGRCPHAEVWLEPDDGHISVLGRAPDALRWLDGVVRRGAAGA